MTNINYENDRLLDIVDEKDQVVDSKPRREIHNLGLLHREIHVWMFDENRNVFFQKRGLHRPSAGLLDATVGGHVNKGEDYLQAAVRETKEETDISVSQDDLIELLKFRKISPVSPKKDPLHTTNNFFRKVYIFRHPIKEDMLKKEIGIPGGGFQKLSYDILNNSAKEHREMFQKFVFTEEIPHVLKYLNESTL